MPFENEFSVTGSIMASQVATPISSGGSTSLLEILQETVSTKLLLVLVFLPHVNYLCYLTQYFSSQSQNHYLSQWCLRCFLPWLAFLSVEPTAILVSVWTSWAKFIPSFPLEGMLGLVPHLPSCGFCLCYITCTPWCCA